MMRMAHPEGQVFGQRLRELRNKRALTQGQLGERAGLTTAHISNLEHGFTIPNLTTILRLAVALECKVTALTSVFDKADVSSLPSE